MVVVWLFLAVPWVCLQFVIVVFPDHTHLLFLNIQTIHDQVLSSIEKELDDPQLKVEQRSGSKQLSTIPDQEHQMGMGLTTRKYNAQKNQDVRPFPAGVYKDIWNRLDRMTKISIKLNSKKNQRNRHRFGTISKNHWRNKNV